MPQDSPLLRYSEQRVQRTGILADKLMAGQFGRAIAQDEIERQDKQRILQNQLDALGASLVAAKDPTVKAEIRRELYRKVGLKIDASATADEEAGKIIEGIQKRKPGVEGGDEADKREWQRVESIIGKTAAQELGAPVPGEERYTVGGYDVSGEAALTFKAAQAKTAATLATAEKAGMSAGESRDFNAAQDEVKRIIKSLDPNLPPNITIRFTRPSELRALLEGKGTRYKALQTALAKEPALRDDLQRSLEIIDAIQRASRARYPGEQRGIDPQFPPGQRSIQPMAPIGKGFPETPLSPVKAIAPKTESALDPFGLRKRQ